MDKSKDLCNQLPTFILVTPLCDPVEADIYSEIVEEYNRCTESNIEEYVFISGKKVNNPSWCLDTLNRVPDCIILYINQSGLHVIDDESKEILCSELSDCTATTADIVANFSVLK